MNIHLLNLLLSKSPLDHNFEFKVNKLFTHNEKQQQQQQNLNRKNKNNGSTE